MSGSPDEHAVTFWATTAMGASAVLGLLAVLGRRILRAGRAFMSLFSLKRRLDVMDADRGEIREAVEKLGREGATKMEVDALRKSVDDRFERNQRAATTAFRSVLAEVRQFREETPSNEDMKRVEGKLDQLLVANFGHKPH